MDFEQCCTECLKNDDLVNEFCRLRGIKHPDKRSPIEIQIEEAIEKANEEFGSLTNYAGMGGIDKLLGVTSSEDDRCVFPDSDVEFDDVLPFES